MWLKMLMIIVTLYLIAKFFEIILTKKNYEFSYYFGVPGSGKTTFAAYLTRKYNKKRKPVYCNVDIKNTYILDKSDIGYYHLEPGLLLWDEAGLDFNNRNFKTNFTTDQLAWFKKHRHYKMDIVMMSQFYNDSDIKLRNLTTKYYILKKSFFPFCISRREIGKRIGVDDLSHQIIDEYFFVPLSIKIIFAPSLWKMFNTHECEELPHKEFKLRI